MSIVGLACTMLRVFRARAWLPREGRCFMLSVCVESRHLWWDILSWGLSEELWDVHCSSKKGFASTICWEKTYVPEQPVIPRRDFNQNKPWALFIFRVWLTLHTVGHMFCQLSEHFSFIKTQSF